MLDEIETTIQEIGRLAMADACEQNRKILVYAEVEDGCISNNLFFIDKNGVVQHRFGSDDLEDTVYKFWDAWRKLPENREWRCIEYVIENQKFGMDLTYPDQIDDTLSSDARRPKVVKKHFSDLIVDYSNPEGDAL